MPRSGRPELMDSHSEADRLPPAEAAPAGAGAVTPAELRFAALAAILVMALTCVPYLICWFATPPGSIYPGILFNADDHGVYYAWMRQARDGQFFFRNLFTNDPQRGIYVHLYFWLLGTVSRLSGLPIPFVYQAGRCLAGIAVLLLVYRLGALFTEKVRTRRLILWTTALSSGLGWLRWRDRISFDLPVDVWQPEAFTFQSLYTNGLFTVSMALMLGVVVGLLLAQLRGQARYAAAAGLCGLLLANIHTYDAITLALVWSVYLLALLPLNAANFRLALRQALLAATIAAPGLAYQLYYYRAEQVFRSRVEVLTATPSPLLYLYGYGLLVPLALYGIWALFRERPAGRFPQSLLPVVWAVTGFAAAYLPVAYQRKLIMGLHFPLALLAGLAIARLAAAAARRRASWGPTLAAAILALLAITPVRFMARDLRLAIGQNLSSTGAHPVFWSAADLAALDWMSDHLARDAVIFANPMFAVIIPATTGRAVYAGHWGETPQFTRKYREAVRFFRGVERDPDLLLRDAGATHVFFGERERAIATEARERGQPGFQPTPRLREVYRRGETVIYEIAPD